MRYDMYIQKSHGCLWWLIIGWWWKPLAWALSLVKWIVLIILCCFID